MNFVRTSILAAALLCASAAFAQTKAVGYDVGSCGPESFAAAHIDYVESKTFTITDYSPVPDVVKHLPNPQVYEYKSKDADGLHYADKRGAEIVVAKADAKGIVGKFVTSKGEIVSIIFGYPSDGTQLADNAKKEFTECQAINAEPDSDDQSNTSDDKHHVIREDESKT